MFKKVLRKDLAEGMRFSANVFFDDGENMLLAQGVPIKARELQALDRWNINYVLTHGSVIVKDEKTTAKEVEEVEELDELDELDNDSNSEEKNNIINETPALDPLVFTAEQILKLPAVLANTEVYDSYRSLVKEMDDFFTDIKKRNDFTARTVDKIVSNLLVLVQTQRSEIVGFILGGEILEMELAKSSVNTAILSTIIASHLAFPRHKLVQIATSALLHDVGMLSVSQAIVQKEGKLDDNEMFMMRSHANYGYKIIVNELLYSDEIGRSAIQHHERYDGEGYPQGLKGENIDLNARIISVADAFEAMVSPKAWRDSLVGYQAMKNLVSDNSRRFDPKVIKAMIQCMGIYPIGSLVLLNNSAICRIIESHNEAPLRPVVRILMDEFGRAFPQNEGDLVDLLKNKNLFIVRAINFNEYRK